MKKRIRIEKVSTWGSVFAFCLTLIFLGIAVWSWGEFNTIKTATDQYIACEEATKQMQEGSDYMTEQVRLYTMTGEKQYMDNYFSEKRNSKKREASLESIKKEFGETEMYKAIQDAYKSSEELTSIEYKAMRLVLETSGLSRDAWPKEVQEVSLTHQEDDLPAVSLSVGTAFADRENPGESIFKDADKALYYVKEHGRNGCGFY